MRTLRFLILMAFLAVPSVALAANDLMMATTTSTQDSGLLDYLKPLFLKETGIDLKWVSTGSGKALEHGKNCDVDVLLVHAPAAELKMVEEGFAVDRRQIMYNDFVIIGPKNDPAGIKGKSVADSLKAFADKKIVFVSRGDKSGTHQMELGLWTSLKMPVPDKESWYVQLGQGMMATINAAAEKNGYTLADRGTWIKFEAVQKDKNPLVILVEGDKSLLNQYSVMTANPAKCPKVKAELAKKFSDWWVSASTQNHIAAFKLEGKQLFFPNAAPPGVRLSSTIGPIDAGIVPLLAKKYEEKTGVTILFEGAGTGATLKKAQTGEFDMVMVHARKLEDAFIAEGFGVDRRDIMYNDFVILGPADDPAKIKGLKSAAEAVAKIAAAKAPFVTRGDMSGTHVKEMEVWEKAGLKPEGSWYLLFADGKLGNKATTKFTDGKKAYTIMDRATYLTMKKEIALVSLVEGDTVLLNYIAVIAVNPAKFPKINAAGAKAFMDWLVSPEAQGIIKTFGVDVYGEPLFCPNAQKR